MSKRYHIGIDIGTYESKGMLIDEVGNCIATHSCSHIMETPGPGYAEHDAEKVWWGDFCQISNNLIAAAHIDPRDINGVGSSTIAPCCLPVDENCNPLRKAILYGVDVRASNEIDYLNKNLGEDYVLKKYGNPITSQSIGPKILWLKNNEPEIFKKTAKFITGSTYIVAKLTGNYVIDNYTAAYFTPMYNLETCDWDYENLSQYCRPDQLASCKWTDEVAGVVTEEAAKETGLAPGTPVITGTADASAEAVGVGIFDPEDMMLMFGSSIYIIQVVHKLTTDKRFWAGPYLFKGTYMVSGGMSTSGTLTRWYRDNFAQDLVSKAKAEGTNAYDLMMRDIENIPPGSNGIVVLPYFSGERTPINDPKAHGVIFGLSLLHGKEHILNACLEGVGYGIAQHFDGFKEMGLETKKVVAVGGGTKNPKWLQMVSDICGRELYTGMAYGAAFGDALLAALGTGFFKSTDDICKIIHFEKFLIPDKDKTNAYATYRKIYTKLYEQTKSLMHEI
ncbi:MAG: FGGY-family carbohydrate kinase [Ruminiclostridium sp.]